MWTVKDCFVGQDCWCGIIVTPEGEDCNKYGDISKEDCRYIVDALNKKPDAEGNANNDHPTPWVVEEFKSGYRCISTESGVGTNSLETAISTAGGIFFDYDRLFVEAVNSFYRQ